MGFGAKCRTLFGMMKTKRAIVKKATGKKMIKKRAVGRPRKPRIKEEPLSDPLPVHFQMPISTELSSVKMPLCQTLKPMKLNSNVSKAQDSPSNSSPNTVYRPPITKKTSELLRKMLLSEERTRFKSTANTTSINDKFNYNYYQQGHSKSNETYQKDSFITNSYKTKWKNDTRNNSNISTNEKKSSVSVTSFLPDLQSFPDIPQLADVDITASSELDNSNYSVNDDQTDTDTGLCIDDSDTLSNQSAENIEQEQRDIDQRWAMSIRMDNNEMSTPLVSGESLSPIDEDSILGPQDTVFMQNDVIQNYIETNNVQFMQLPDSGCEVIRTLQYYESRLVTTPWTLSEHLHNVNGSIFNENSMQEEQLHVTGANHTSAEVANMLPCPIAGCLWYSHSATLYVHLFTCHQEMISAGNLITHVFRCQDIRTFCFFTHLQYVQNTIYIITVSFDNYSQTFVATIQHVSSYGDNTSVSTTTAILTTGSFHNNDVDQHSWTGQVQPYSVPLDVLHGDGRCLFIDPIAAEQCVIINVKLSVPSIYSNDSMFACL